MLWNKHYFTCPPDSGVFVALDKLRPREDPYSQSPERDENAEANFISRLWDTVMLSFHKGKNKRSLPQERTNQVLKCDQRVVTFIDDCPARGTVRYIGQEKDASGNVHTIVGLEMVGNAHKLEFMYHKDVNFTPTLSFSCISWKKLTNFGYLFAMKLTLMMNLSLFTCHHIFNLMI